MRKSITLSNTNKKIIESKREELKLLIARFSNGKDIFDTTIPGVSVFCISSPNPPACLIYEPCLCMAAQGAKLITLAGESYVYDAKHYLIASINLPTMAQVIHASKDNPYYGFKLRLHPGEIAQLMIESGFDISQSAPLQRGIALGKVDYPLLDAVSRLISLLDSPKDIQILAPLIKKEIIYRLLSGPQGSRLMQLSISGSPTNRMAKAITWIMENFESKIKIENLADIANMSTSAFHKHFRRMTAMSPLQYQKVLRLQEARKMMLSDSADVATAAYKVGYESATQFNREYKRLFGDSPRREIMKQLRAV